MSCTTENKEGRLPRFDFEDSSISTCAPSTVTGDDNEKALVDFNRNKSPTPESWSSAKKVFAVGTSLITVINGAMASSLPSGAMAYTADYFHVTSQQQLALPISVFLIGYIFGPLLFSPLSEIYGRRVILLISFAGYTASTCGCALAPTWSGLLVFRFLVGFAASAPYTIAGGICADVYSSAAYRGRAIMMLMVCLNVGPAAGPIISGFVAPIHWRWQYWVALMIAGVSWIPLCFFPETYGPVLAARLAHDAHNASPDLAVPTPPNPAQRGVSGLIQVALIRPFRLFAEPIILATSSFMALLYAIFYLFFEAYPIIFGGIYKMSPGIAALAFIPSNGPFPAPYIFPLIRLVKVSLGACLDIFIVVAWDRYLLRAKIRGDAWAFSEEYRRIPLACIGGPLCALALFWLGWSANSNCHWLVPMLAGVPYGMGLEIIFMALISYLSDGYGTLTASALAAAAISRSLCAALLPLVAQSLYTSMGVSGASSLLGGVTLLMSTVPFVLLKYGGTLRERSKFCRQVGERKHEADLGKG